MHSCTKTSAAVGGMRKEFENKEVNSLAAQHQEAGACSKQQEAQWSPGPPVGSAPPKESLRLLHCTLCRAEKATLIEFLVSKSTSKFSGSYPNIKPEFSL